MHISTLKNIRRNLPIALLFSLYLLSSVQTQFVRISARTNVLLIEPNADSFVDNKNMIGDSRVNLNYGGQDKLDVYYWHTWAIVTEYRFTYLKFNLTDFPTALEIQTATLNLFTKYVSATMDISTHYCSDNSWAETEITWNNRPMETDESTDTLTVASVGWYTWDIKNDVIKALQSSEKFLTEVLKPDETGDLDVTVQFYPKEASEGFRPYLRISFNKIQPTIDFEPIGNKKLGETVRFYGSMNPAWSGINIFLTITDPEEDSIDLPATQTDENGDFYFDYTLNKKGYWKIKAISISDDFFESVTSSEISVPVDVDPFWDFIFKNWLLIVLVIIIVIIIWFLFLRD